MTPPAAPDGPPGPATGLQAVAGCVGAVAAVMGGYLAVGILVIELVPDRVVATLLADLAAVGVVVWIRHRRPRWLALDVNRPQSPRTGPVARGRREALLVLGGLVTAFLAGQSASLVAYDALGSAGFDRATDAANAAPAAMVIVFSLLVAPAGEEALLRGALYPAVRRFAPPAYATVVTCVVFSLLHGNLVQGIAVVPLGVLLAVVYERTQRLAVLTLLHGAFNVAALVVPVSIVEALASPTFVAATVMAFSVVAAALWRRAPIPPPGDRVVAGEGI